LPTAGQIEVVDLVWKGLRPVDGLSEAILLPRIEVVDLVWKGLRHPSSSLQKMMKSGIEVVDLVWKGLRLHVSDDFLVKHRKLKSLTWFGRDCDRVEAAGPEMLDVELKSLTWFGRDCDHPVLW